MIEATLHSQLAELIGILSRPAIPVDKQLWTEEETAAYLGLKPRTVVENYATRADFPKAILLTKGAARTCRRWKAKEVMDWADRQR